MPEETPAFGERPDFDRGPANAVAGVIYEVTGPFDRFAGTAAPTPQEPTTIPIAPATAPASQVASKAASPEVLPVTGGGGAGLAGLGVGAIGWWLHRQTRRTAAEPDHMAGEREP